jgi:hypothetical protein
MTKFITKTFTEYTGGGFYVDFVELNDGRCIGIDENSLVLYPSFDVFNNGDTYGLPCLQFDKPIPEEKETRVLVKEDRVISNQIFERFDDVIEIPEGFISTSWRNNACPSMALEIDENTSITIWIDYKNPELRETEGKRFIVSMETLEEGFEPMGQFDTLEEAIQKAYILKNGYSN